MVSLAPKFREALQSFKAQLVAEFGSRLRRMVLFGSVSRGQERWDSDVDVLVLMDQVSHRERRHIIDLAADELTCREVLISPTIMTEIDFLQMEARERLLPQEIARDGVLL
jgi:predicted nucleotidyltransferase